MALSEAARIPLVRFVDPSLAAAVVVLTEEVRDAATGAGLFDGGSNPLSDVPRLARLRKPLLASGIAASLLFVGTDLLAGSLSEGYSFYAQSISELAAVGAPTRPLVVPLQLTYDVLMIAFGLGVWATAGHRRAARVTAAMVMGNAATAAVFRLFPMHVGEPAGTANVALGATSMVLFVLAIASGAVAYRGWFRIYSIATLTAYVTLAVWGSLRGSAAPADAGASVGIQERTMVLGYLAWVILLAVALLRADEGRRAVAG